MALSSHLSVSTTLVPTPPAPSDRQRVPCFVGVHTVIGDTAKAYTSLDDMGDDGWDDADPLYNMVSTALAQEEIGSQLTKWFIGKRSTPVATVWTFNVVDDVDGVVSISEGDTVVATYTVATDTAAEIATALLASVVAGYTGASVDADTFTITKGEAGVPMTLTVGGAQAANLSGSQTTAAVGIYADLDAIQAVVLDGKTVGAQVESYVVAPALGQIGLTEGARWAHGDGLHIVQMQSNDGDIIDSGQTDDGASRIAALGYTRSEVCYRASLTDYVQAGMVGHLLPRRPGSAKTSWWNIIGSTLAAGTTETQDTTCRTKRASWVDLIDVDGKVKYFGGRDGQATPLYHHLARDHWYDRIQARIVYEMSVRSGIDLTDEGLASTLIPAIRAEMDSMISQGSLAEGYTITAVPVADVPAGEIALGDYKTTGKITVSGFLRVFTERVSIGGEFGIPTT